MKSVDFPEADNTLAPPGGSSNIDPLRVKTLNYQDGDFGTVSCWKLSLFDLLQIVFTRRVYVAVLGKIVPPIKVSPNIKDF